MKHSRDGLDHDDRVDGEVGVPEEFALHPLAPYDGLFLGRLGKPDDEKGGTAVEGRRKRKGLARERVNGEVGEGFSEEGG